MEEENLSSDYQLVKKLKNGDTDAFDELFRGYAHRLLQFSLTYLKSDEDAEEIVQEVFIKVWSKRKELKPGNSFKSYLFTIAFNFIKKRFIKIAREKAFKDNIIYSYLEQENDLDKLIDYKSLLGKVEMIINSMPPRRKEIFIKRKYHDLTLKQIAEEMGISPNTVENQLSAAQKYIKEKLEKEKLAGLLFFILFVSV